MIRPHHVLVLSGRGLLAEDGKENLICEEEKVMCAMILKSTDVFYGHKRFWEWAVTTELQVFLLRSCKSEHTVQQSKYVVTHTVKIRWMEILAIFSDDILFGLH